MDGTMAAKSLTKEQRNYCMTKCPHGKKKVHELLSSCESVLDAAADMQYFTQACFGSPECGASKPIEKDQLN